MLLAIDAGNTNTVFAVHDGSQIRGRWRITTNDARTAEEYVVWLKQLMEMDGVALGDITGVIISTVVPQALFNLQRLAQRYFHADPVVIGDPSVDLGLEVRVDRPQEVGADRIVNAVAAHKSYDGALIVVDFGTATTFDVVGADGGYEGGIIAPGINLSLEALHTAAAKLPRIAVEKPQAVVGKSTVPAMQSGVYWGYIGLIEGLVTRIRADQNDPTMKVIATGGLAAPLNEGTNMIDVVDHDLTIRGLIDIYALNRPTS